MFKGKLEIYLLLWSDNLEGIFFNIMFSVSFRSNKNQNFHEQ